MTPNLDNLTSGRLLGKVNPGKYQTNFSAGPDKWLKFGAFLDNRTAIESWFDDQWRTVQAPFYASVDLRNAEYKLAPVDTNLFPAGFNNLDASFRSLCMRAIKAEIDRMCPGACSVLLVPENHTRNLPYLENVAALVDILIATGLEVRVGSLLPDLAAPRTVDLPSGRQFTLEPLTRHDGRVRIADFDPCFVLLNNDLSAGRPAILEGIEQPIVPPLALGWSNRRKSGHFNHYRNIANEFSKIAGIDPWLIDPIFRNCGSVNFQKREGEECLSKNVDAVLTEVAQKYKEYGIKQQPFVIVKDDAGTYGMAIMAVKNAYEVRELNRKQRTKMARSKEGRAVTQVLVQEGVYTSEVKGVTTAVAEPVIYMIGSNVVGGFYRVHPQRGPSENLNTPGMYFEPVYLSETGMIDFVTPSTGTQAARFYTYGVVARLALLAAARELEEISGGAPA